DARLQRRGEGARRDESDLPLAREHGGALPGDPLSVEDQPDPCPAWVLFAEPKLVAPDELPLVEPHGPAESGGERVDLLGELVSVQRHGGFQAESIPGAETAGNDPMRPTGLQQRLPDLARRPGADDHFETVLARIARPADDRIDAAQ